MFWLFYAVPRKIQSAIHPGRESRCFLSRRFTLDQLNAMLAKSIYELE